MLIYYLILVAWLVFMTMFMDTESVAICTGVHYVLALIFMATEHNPGMLVVGFATMVFVFFIRVNWGPQGSEDQEEPDLPIRSVVDILMNPPKLKLKKPPAKGKRRRAAS